MFIKCIFAQKSSFLLTQPQLKQRHVLIRTDNMSVVSYIITKEEYDPTSMQRISCYERTVTFSQSEQCTSPVFWTAGQTCFWGWGFLKESGGCTLSRFGWFGLATGQRRWICGHPLRGVYMLWNGECLWNSAVMFISTRLLAPCRMFWVFLQYRLDSGSLTINTESLRGRYCLVRSPLGGQSIGRHALVVSFSCTLHPPRPPSVPPWVLEVVLIALSQLQLEPLHLCI